MIDDADAFVAAFAGPATYTASGAGTAVLAVIEDGDTWIGIPAPLRDSVDCGQVRLGRAWVRPNDLPMAPAFGHSLAQDGVAWIVADARPEGDMLVLGLFAGVWVVDVTVQSDAEVSDGAMGYRRAPVDIWSGKAAMRGLSGKERVMAARQVGVGYRSGWVPACPALVAGCRIVTPTETLQVTSAFTDHARGWTVFEAEARQEEQH